MHGNFYQIALIYINYYPFLLYKYTADNFFTSKLMIFSTIAISYSFFFLKFENEIGRALLLELYGVAD